MISLTFAPGVAYGQTGCERSGAFFGCPATVSNVRMTVTCPGSSRTSTGSVQSMTATEFALTAAESQAKSNATARREAERVARDRALARCSAPPPAGAGGVLHTTSVGALEMGACGTEGRFFACTATARNVSVRARCSPRGRSATGKVASVAATDYGTTLAEAQNKAKGTALREAERVALDRARARLRC